MKKYILLSFAAIASGLGILADCENWPSSGLTGSDGPIVRGEWNSNFKAGKAYAEEHNLPLLVFWANYDCKYCKALEESVASEDFIEWQQKRRIVMVFAIGVCNDDKKAAFEFADNGNGFNYPILRVYWPKKDGTVVSRSFRGRDKVMPSRVGDTLEEQLRNSVDGILAGYVPMIGGEFAAGNTIGDRLEAQIGYTKYVDVPLQRQSSVAEIAANDVLSVTYGGNKLVTNITWQVGETSKYIRVDADYATATAGESMVLRLKNVDSGSEEGSVITFVNRENSPKNPLWIGARMSSELQWGEWTMDIDAAQQKVADAGTGYVLILVAGGLWCPDCARTDTYLIDTPQFKQWAADNQVACVAIDIPSDPTVGGPSLLTRDVKEVSAKYMEADPDHGAYQSGSGYLSRWMISDADAEIVSKRNAEFVGVNTLNGGWNRPERANQKRTGVPIFILLKNDGTIAGRIETFASTSPSNADYVTGNIRRLNELLATIDDEGGESDYHPSTTQREMDAQGGASVASLSGADQADTVKLTNGIDNATLVVTADGNTSAGLANTLSIYVKTSGVISVVSSVTGKFSDGTLTNKVEMVFTEAEYFARLEIAGLSDLAVFGQDAEISSTATVKSSLEYQYGEIAFESAEQSVFVPDGNGSVKVCRRNGMFGDVSVHVVLHDKGTADGFYTFTETNLVWRSGDSEDKTVTFEVARTDKLASGSFTLALENNTGYATVSSDKHVVTLSDTADPCFKDFNMSTIAWKQFTTDTSFELRNVKPGKSVTLKKLSGKLPSGLKLAYDKESGLVILEGTATKPGTYEAIYAVSQGGVTGLPATLKIEVFDPATLNAYTGKKRDEQPLALFARTSNTNVVAGIISVSISAKNKITAKYQGTESKTLQFSGSWQEVGDDGTVSTILTKSGYQLYLSMDKDGTLQAEMSVTSSLNAFAADGTILTGYAELPNSDYSQWAGTYTVTLVSQVAVASGIQPAGTGYLILTVKSSGKVSWKGYLADGSTISGSSRMESDYVDGEGDRVAELVLFKRISKSVFGARLAIKGNGAKWNDDELAQMIHDAPEVSAYVLRREQNVSDCSLLVSYGGWFEKGISPFTLCETFGYDADDIELCFDTDKAAASEKRGALIEIPSSTVAAQTKKLVLITGADGVKFSYSQKTGEFSGSARLQFEDGTSVSGTYKGVLLPGWSGCPECSSRKLVNRPFGSGTFFFKDSVSGKNYKRSLPVDLMVKTAVEN